MIATTNSHIKFTKSFLQTLKAQLHEDESNDQGADFTSIQRGSVHGAVGTEHRGGSTALHSNHCTGNPEKKSLVAVRDVAPVSPSKAQIT